MAEIKTKLNDAPVADFIDAIKEEQVRKDCWVIVNMMQKATKAPPKMWGTSIVGFGTSYIKYASGRVGEWMLIGFSPRKQNLTLYIMSGYEQRDELLAKLGKYTTAKSCLYIKRLSDVDLPTLEKLIKATVKHMRKVHAPEKQ